MRVSYPKLIAAVGLGAYFIQAAATPETYRFLDSVDLIFHEAGHWIFALGPQWLDVAGGSIMQCLVPLICVLTSLYQGRRFTAALIGFWLAQNILNVSVYAADALKMQLPLLGGDSTTHDWNWLLWHFGQLRHTAAIAGAIRAAGWLVLIVSLLAALYLSFSFESDGTPETAPPNKDA